MYYALVFLHIFVSIAMICIVLLQSGKGAEMGASFGAGGSQTVFGASGGNTFMNKMTTCAAILFMLTSLTLARVSSSVGHSSIMSSKSASQAPAKSAAPAQAPAAPAAPQSAVPAQQAPAAPVAPQTAPPAQSAPAAPAK